MRKTTSSEFTNWLAYIEWELGIPRREEWYLAQIALEVHRKLMKNPKKAKLKDFILKFTEGKKTMKKRIKSTLETSKAAWLGWLGIKYK